MVFEYLSEASRYLDDTPDNMARVVSQVARVLGNRVGLAGRASCTFRDPSPRPSHGTCP